MLLTRADEKRLATQARIQTEGATATAPVVRHSVIYGMSDNTTRWWDNTRAAHIGYRPQDSSEPWRAAVEAADPRPDPKDPALTWQGGVFVNLGPYD